MYTGLTSLQNDDRISRLSARDSDVATWKAKQAGRRIGLRALAILILEAFELMKIATSQKCDATTLTICHVKILS